MIRTFTTALVLSALCGCSILGTPDNGKAPPPDVAKAPSPPADAAAPPSDGGLGGYDRPVAWDMNRLMPLCPRCNHEVQLRSTICSRCYGRYRWHDLPVDDSPRGAFARLKLAEVYNDYETFQECVCQSDLKAVMNSLGNAVEAGREVLLEPQVIDEAVDGDEAKLTIVQRGQQVTLNLVREGGKWKLSLRALQEDVFTGKAGSRATAIARAIERYRQERGRLPNAPTWIRELRERDAKGKPYYDFNGMMYASHGGGQRGDVEGLADPWWGEYVYRPGSSDGRRDFLLYSKGPNGRDDDGSGDDILPK